MRRRTFLAALSSAIFSPPNSFAQQPTPVRRITLILGNSEDDPNGHERVCSGHDCVRLRNVSHPSWVLRSEEPAS
jgi:hypothetical protein